MLGEPLAPSVPGVTSSHCDQLAAHHHTIPTPVCVCPSALQGVDVVAVHGDKDQEERTTAIAQFKAGTKDVLVATDVASKGLDFPGIQHVINYDMPSQIEDYVHRWVAGVTVVYLMESGL